MFLSKWYFSYPIFHWIFGTRSCCARNMRQLEEIYRSSSTIKLTLLLCPHLHGCRIGKRVPKIYSNLNRWLISKPSFRLWTPLEASHKGDQAPFQNNKKRVPPPRKILGEKFSSGVIFPSFISKRRFSNLHVLKPYFAQFRLGKKISL